MQQFCINKAGCGFVVGDCDEDGHTQRYALQYWRGPRAARGEPPGGEPCGTLARASCRALGRPKGDGSGWRHPARV